MTRTHLLINVNIVLNEFPKVDIASVLPMLLAASTTNVCRCWLVSDWHFLLFLMQQGVDIRKLCLNGGGGSSIQQMIKTSEDVAFIHADFDIITAVLTVTGDDVVMTVHGSME
jgi:hypothetical protein